MSNAFHVKATAIPGSHAEKQEYNSLRVSVDYSKAGTSWFSGQHYEGGIWIYVTPQKENTEGMFITLIGDGLKHQLESSTRLNRKRVLAKFEESKGQIAMKSGIAYDVLKKVADKYGLEI